MRIGFGFAVLILTGMADAQNGADNPFGTVIVPRFYDADYRVSAANDDEATEADRVLQQPAEAQFSFSANTMQNDAQGADSSAASLSLDIEFDLDTSTGVLMGSFSANASALAINADDQNGFFPNAFVTIGFCLQFDVIGMGANIQITGSESVAELNDASGSIEGFVSESPQRFDLSGNGSIAIEQSFDVSAGRHNLALEIEACANDGSATSMLDFQIVVAPVVIDEVFWSANDGDYDVPENWEPQTVPGSAQTAIFDRDGTYSVSFGSHETGLTILERGFVEFGGTAYTLSGGDEDSGSLVVGASSEDGATLDLQLNQLNTLHTILGDLGVTNGSILSTAATQWTNQGRLTIGRDGMGGVAIANDAQLSTGELRLGDLPGSNGSLIIENGISNGSEAKQDVLISLIAGSTGIGLEGTGTATLQNALVQTGETQLGVFPGSMGSLTILESPQFAFWDLTGDLFVGNEGEAMVDIQAGGILRSAPMVSTGMWIANGPGSMGVVQVNGAFASLFCSSNILVGPGGEGVLLSQNGGDITAFSLHIGPAPGNEDARGDVLVQGEGAIGTVADLEAESVINVGSNGAGTLIALNGASILSQTGGVGNGAGGEGFVTLDNARWVSTNELLIGDADPASGDVNGTGVITLMNGALEAIILILENGSTIQGAGTLDALGAGLQGTVAPGITTTVGFKSAPRAAALLGDAWPVKGTDDPEPIGALNFEGDVSFDGATITIEAASESNFDQIEITGDASLTNTTINFNFIDGYLPQTGDELAFLTAANITIDAATTFTYTGATPGFQFDVMNTGSALMFQAQSDAQPEGGEGEGEGEGEGDGQPGGCASNDSSNKQGGMHFDLLICLVVVVLAAAQRRRA